MSKRTYKIPSKNSKELINVGEEEFLFWKTQKEEENYNVFLFRTVQDIRNNSQLSEKEKWIALGILEYELKNSLDPENVGVVFTKKTPEFWQQQRKPHTEPFFKYIH